MLHLPAFSHCLAITFLCGILCACGVSSTFTTHAFVSGPLDPKKIMIVETAVEHHRSSMEAFQGAIVDRLHACGIETDFIHQAVQPVTLSLDNNQAKDRNNVSSHIRSFAPDFLLSVKEPSYHFEGPERYKVEFIDLSQKKTVWNGTVQLQHAGILSGMQNIGVTFADDIMDRMQTDGIIKKCPSRQE